MAKYIRMLLNRGGLPQGRLISRESFELMTQRVIWTGQDFYGYGLVTYPVEGGDWTGHGGASPGFMSAIVMDLEAGLGVVTMCNRAGEPDATLQLSRYILALLLALQRTGQLPPPPDFPDPCATPDAINYAGTYRNAQGALELTAENGRLLLQHDGQKIALERRFPDSFYVRHPDFELFLLEFRRAEGKVVEVFHGPDWYVNQSYSGPLHFDYPAEWKAYTGHYRTRNPGVSNFRVVLRKGGLEVIYPRGPVEVLKPLGNGLFRYGEDPRMPDTIRFDAILDGQALLADYCGCQYYRAATP